MSVRVPPRRPGVPPTTTGSAGGTTSTSATVPEETRAPPATPPRAAARSAPPDHGAAGTGSTATATTRADARATHGADVRARATEARLAGATPGTTTTATPDGLDAARARAGTARDRAAAMDYQFVDWGDRDAVLNQMTQFDSADGGRDSTRCGAAALTGGLVLSGPEAVGDGRERILERIGTLRERANAMGTPEQRTEANRLLDEAETHMAALPRGDPHDWRYGDLGEFQEGVASTMAADRYIASGGTDTSSGVRESSVAQYRDLLWEGHRPTYLGEPVDVIALTPEAGSGMPGHAVLGVGGATHGTVIYDPWPQGDGSARMSPHETDAITTYEYDDASRSHVDLRRDVDELRAPVHGHRARRGDG